jgi:hypothetical protein
MRLTDEWSHHLPDELAGKSLFEIGPSIRILPDLFQLDQRKDHPTAEVIRNLFERGV